MKNLVLIIMIVVTGISFSCQEDPTRMTEPEPDVQLKASDNLDPSVVEAFYQLGINDSGIAGIQMRLLEIGITREHVNSVMKTIPYIAREILAEGDDFELNVRIKNYLQNDLGLTDDQIELVIGIAARISNLQPNRG